MAAERTLIILKPDAVNRGLCGKVLARFEEKGFKIVGLKMMWLGREILEKHYAHLASKPFFPDLVGFMSSSPVILGVVEGRNAVEAVRNMCGVTDANKAAPGTIRGDFALSTSRNIIHASDSIETAKREISLFFKDEELYNYELNNKQFLYAGDELNR
ncbi:MAG: nucleoside-diphosphate kinase [Candidatus Micrarchaeota archaeon]|nr:nucleoside-diphosphate kinase [Candidatus Micrarchaeota archaeon]